MTTNDGGLAPLAIMRDLDRVENEKKSIAKLRAAAREILGTETDEFKAFK